MFLAHPFAPEVPRSHEVFDVIDGVEIYNSRSEHTRCRDANLRAQKLAAEKSRGFSAGSDAHFKCEVGAAYWECENARTAQQVYTALKEGDGRVFGGRASPLPRVHSQWLKLFRLRAWSFIPKLIPRTLRALLLALRPCKKAVLINFPERNYDI